MSYQYNKINYKDIDPNKITLDENNIKYDGNFFKIKTPVLNGYIDDYTLCLNEYNIINTNFLIFKDKMLNILKMIKKEEKCITKYTIDEKTKLFDKNKQSITLKNVDSEFNFIAFIVIYKECFYVEKLMKI